MRSTKTRVNASITAPEVFLIGSNGASIGVFSIRKALDLARESNLDLVEVSPHANPPVCKLLDYGKYKYTMSKKGKTKKKKQGLKEIRMQPKISDHDLGFKTQHVQQFLQEGNKVKVTIRFRGRELSHTQLGEEVLQRILDMISFPFVVDKLPSMEGRMMTMMLSPSSKKGDKGKDDTHDQRDNRSSS